MHLTEWARRHAVRPEGHPLAQLHEGRSEAEVARDHGLPRSHVRGLTTFYDLLHGQAARRCTGTSCTFPGGVPGGGPPIAEGAHVHCLGHCYAPPASTEREAGPIPRRSLVNPPVVLRHLLAGHARLRREDYSLPGGLAILEAVERSGLRGRGGAAFPTGRKWRTARETAASDRIVVVNGDEGDPGSYVDRLLLEEDPHAVLAGVVACARAIGARTGILFVRGEYPKAHVAVRRAIAEAEEEGLLPDGLELRLVTGAGSYVAGEETALLSAIEGRRAEPWVKPPYPAQRGLFGLPTIVQNVETLAAVPELVRAGRKGDTKAICLSGAIRTPGVVEIRFGMTLRDVLEQGGGGAPEGRTWRLALVGGPMGRVVPVAQFDTKLSYDDLPGMGHGGVVVLDERVTPRRLAEHLFEFAARESCGNCAPCRLGTAQLAKVHDRGGFERLMRTLEEGSFCGFGQGVPRPLRDLLEHYGAEVLS